MCQRLLHEERSGNRANDRDICRIKKSSGLSGECDNYRAIRRNLQHDTDWELRKHHVSRSRIEVREMHIPRNRHRTVFMQVLGFGAQNVSAMAVATLDSTEQNNCAIPLALCSKGSSSTTPPYNLIVGNWYTGRYSSGSGATGNYNWVDFTPPSGWRIRACSSSRRKWLVQSEHHKSSWRGGREAIASASVQYALWTI